MKTISWSGLTAIGVLVFASILSVNAEAATWILLGTAVSMWAVWFRKKLQIKKERNSLSRAYVSQSLHF